jgi:ABC-2 type transport system ATP-binding protein
MKLIDIQGLVKKYDQYRAVEDISFSVEKGEILGFLGPNGAGKTTTMNIITGYMPPTAGTVKVCGFEVSEEPLEVKRRIGYLPENPPLYFEMTVLEYLNFICQLKKVPKAETEEQIKFVIEKVKLDEVKKRLIKNLSKGYRQRVGLAQALIGNPEVLILDEPTVGLDPKQIIEIRELIKELGKEHTIILSSHILPEVNAVCSRIVIINKGKIVAVDTPENLTQNLNSVINIEATIDGNSQKVSEIILQLDNVKSVDVIENNDESNMESKYLIETAGDCDIRKEMFYKLAKEECPILEMGVKKISLEDVFLKLTKTEEEV